ncbi:MAG: gluconate 2-dehydrogenase subunit 3 family protein [Eudoraea sp.]
MKRKTFINTISLASGGAIILPTAGLLQSCEYHPKNRVTLQKEDIGFLNEIGETILPATEASPGAKAAEIGNFMYSIFQDCMEPENQAIFLSGLNELDAQAAALFNTSFIDASPIEKTKLLEKIQLEAIIYNEEQEGMEEILPHYFDLFKNLTTYGYFTSEIGMTIARDYLPIPGKYEACISYKIGDRPWAT